MTQLLGGGLLADLDACAAVSDAYGAVPSIAVGDVRLVITRKPWGSMIAIPGTRKDVLADWIRDLAALPHESRTHPQLGECHSGCLSGAEMAFDPALRAIGDDPYILALHSLGALGVLLGAMLTLAGKPPLRIVTFGAMRVSIGADVPNILHAAAGVSYRNAGDPVMGLPPWPYGHWRAETQLGADAPDWIPDHYIEAYSAALGLLAVGPLV
jgi:hypothetical protein